MAPVAASELAASAPSAAAWRGLPLKDAAQSMHALGGVLGHDGVSPLRVVAALASCLLVGIVIIVLMRRSGHFAIARRSATASHVRILQSVRLNSRTTLYVLAHGDVEIIIASDAGGVKTLHTASSSKQEPRP
ncbi:MULTISPECIES: flagellar biosynthetic protein FliO [unclassified Caballeronia]|uniref:flagellar biosynthetic protein FliO n=1 Tax=unclassified Caballeronia TaxID=2646786 RepID=UPI001FD3E861|nr:MULTISPECIES: flagellar biosynthetic protein FliO [unclassified Caballeronia]MDR5774148.1 flagellar biosynthetic protein FliO [Caballeronia sp. LZ002]MDR5849583.1 flagellar biosynthetic protein FliO [Caballeronia sp. LZ003]